MGLIAYPVPGKQKAVNICNAFLQGAPKLADGDVFFGVNHGNLAPYLRAKALKRDWYYIDNAYFDKHRGTYFRVTKNALQRTGLEKSNGDRFHRLGVEIKPWRTDLGNDLLVCEQNENFMAAAVGYRGNWTKNTVARLTDYRLPFKIRVRQWNPDKVKVALALLDDLKNLHCVVTHSSMSALTAMLEGVPAVSEAGAVRNFTGPLSREAVLSLPRPDNREQLAWSLADGMFTMDEIRSGVAWEWMQK